MCCVARWWTGRVVWLAKPGAMRSEVIARSSPGRKRPAYRSFPPACLQEMQDEGGAQAGGREVETGEDR